MRIQKLSDLLEFSNKILASGIDLPDNVFINIKLEDKEYFSLYNTLQIKFGSPSERNKDINLVNVYGINFKLIRVPVKHKYPLRVEESYIRYNKLSLMAFDAIKPMLKDFQDSGNFIVYGTSGHISNQINITEMILIKKMLRS